MVYILWDSSHIWGLMAFGAMRALGLECCLVKSLQIAQDGILGKPTPSLAKLLLVPGGNARQKAAALGQSGVAAIREWLAAGGAYLGFCGGAGLALSDAGLSLRICPWTRIPYQKRLYHLLSGHVLADTRHGPMSMPVWWPGRFAFTQEHTLEILATYKAPDKDLWLADMPLDLIPANMFSLWQKNRDLDKNLDFPVGQPLTIQGNFDSGSYILSYAHLETPGSPKANAWLCGLLNDIFHLPARPPAPGVWEKLYDPDFPAMPSDGYPGHRDFTAAMNAGASSFQSFIQTAAQLGVLYPRTSWLWGWRQGFAGIACNNLLAVLNLLANTAPSDQLSTYWRQTKAQFNHLFTTFINDAHTWLWNSRLDSILSSLDANASRRSAITHTEIFGHPMLGGGQIQQLLNLLEEYIFLGQQNILQHVS